ncbi:MAG: putative sugar kinase [Methanomassiliicoccales archaeon PtaU1.Bin124]|nr:MAG: putative sugar kinase [Methanomassiliicoccales archaeon PtaU1.Bin124]
MPDPYLCVYGHTNLDYIMGLKEFPEKNTSVEVLEKRQYFGGTAANVATIASSLGVPTALASYVGRDLPAPFRSLMEEKGVMLEDLVEVEGFETPTVWIVSDSKHDQIAYVYQGPMGVMDRMPLLTEQALRSKKVHVMTGRPEYYLKLMREMKAAGKDLGFDPAQEIHNIWDAARFRKALPMCDIFFGNENEIRTAMRYSGAEREEDLLDLVPLVIKTVGAKGSILISKEGRMDVPAVEADRVVDTTGCGDAFRAGFYAGLYRRMGLVEAAVIGSSAASFIIEQPGALTRIPGWDEVRERAEKVI